MYLSASPTWQWIPEIPRLFSQQNRWWMDTIRPNMRSEYSMTHTRHTHLFLTSCSPASPYFPTLSGSLCHARTIKAVKYPYKQKPEGSSSGRWPFHGQRNVPSHGIRWTMVDRLGKNLGRMMINHGMKYISTRMLWATRSPNLDGSSIFL